MNKMQKQFKKAQKKGLTPMEILHMREIAKKEADRMETQATEKAFLYMLAIPLSILTEDYWKKSARKRIPKFIYDVAKLYEAVQEGIVTNEELAADLYDVAGVHIEAEWLKAMGSDEVGSDTD